MNYFPTGVEVAGRAPNSFSYPRDDLFALIDPLDARVVVIGSNGRIEGGSDPLSIVPMRVRTTDSAIEFIEAITGRRVVLPRNVHPVRIRSLAITDAAPEWTTAAAPITQLGARWPWSQARVWQLRLRTGADTAANKILGLHSLAGGYLSDAQYLGRDAKGRYYVQTSEITQSKPRIDVKVFAQRLAADGALEAAAAVPLGAMNVVPDRFVAVSADGTATLLFAASNGILLQKLQFQERLRCGLLAPASVASLTKIDAVVHEVSLRATTPEELAPAESIRPSTPAQILARANEYLGVNWSMTRVNFEHDGIQNVCSKGEGKYWSRPRRFSESSIGKMFAAKPYYWGGDDTPSSFRTKIAAGLFAGNVCTCREKQYDYCQVKVATDVDCSEFVSRSWGISKHGTAELRQVAQSVSLTQLRPGDVRKPRSAVRQVPTGCRNEIRGSRARDTLGVRRVCSSVYGAAQLQTYEPLRFFGVTD